MTYIISILLAVFVFISLRLAGRQLEKSRFERISSMGERIKLASLFILIGWFLLHTIIAATYQIPAGHVGIIYEFGSIKGQIPEGLQGIFPWQTATTVSIQITSHKFQKLSCFSSETQAVYIDATLNISVSPQTIQKLYRDVGQNWFQVVVEPRILQNFKDETVKFKSVDIAPHREDIRRSVSKRLETELSPYSIEVKDLLLDNIDFEPGFKQAIENKQIATQNALEEEQKVLVERHKAEQKVETAKGEGQAILEVANKQAEANNLLNSTLTPNLIQYTFVQKLAPEIEVMLLPAGQNFLLDTKALLQTK